MPFSNCFSLELLPVAVVKVVSFFLTCFRAHLMWLTYENQSQLVTSTAELDGKETIDQPVMVADVFIVSKRTSHIFKF